jgi:neutral ceramidase
VRAGVARIDITPTESIRMEGMLRAHRSEGVHDPIFAKALVLSNDEGMDQACAIVAVDVCKLPAAFTDEVRGAVERELDIPAPRTIIAAKHIHSGPESNGDGEPEVRYSRTLREKLRQVVREAAGVMQPVKAGAGSGREDTISQYRRLMADDGHVVMNWEPYPRERLIGPLGEIDPEVGVLKIEDLSGQVLCILFNHAGHPNVLSGDNYLISAEYPGFAEKLLEEEFGGTAMFVNGAQGTMDIDGLGPRDWAEMERLGGKLAAAVAEVARDIEPMEGLIVRCANVKHGLPARKVSGEQLAWAEEIIKQTGGEVQPLADGVGDDYKALLIKQLHAVQERAIPAEHICIAIDDTAFFSFPGELFTEIGMEIKARSPFARTYIIGLANGSIGYVPTRKAIAEGGYAVDVRRVDADAEDLILSRGLALLGQVFQS